MRSVDGLRADYVAAWATGAGIGAGAFMLTWLLANRVLSLLMSAPAGPIFAMAAAIVAGLTVAVVQGWRLSRRFVSAG